MLVDAVGNLSFLCVRIPGLANTTERTKDQRMGVRGSKKSHRTPIVQITPDHLRCLGLLALRLCQNRYDFGTLFFKYFKYFMSEKRLVRRETKADIVIVFN